MARRKERILEDIRKEQIYEGALQVISQKGSSSATLDQVAKAAGLSKGGITYYYSSKTDLFIDVFNTFFDRVFQKVQEEMAKHPDPIDKLLSFLWLTDDDDQHVKYIYPFFFELTHLAAIDPKYRKIFHDWANEWVSLISTAVAEILSDEKEIEDTSRLISSIYQGIMVRWYLDREGHSTEWARESVRRSIHKLLEPAPGT